MSDLLDILDGLAADDARKAGDVLVHAMRPDMWGACGWTSIGPDRPQDNYVLTMNRRDGITCTDCLHVMTEDPWPT